MSRGRHLPTVAVGAAALVLVLAAVAWPSHAGTSPRPVRPAAPVPPVVRRLTTLVLTLDRLDHYHLSASGDALHFRASPHDSDKNLRFLVWDPDLAAATDEEACALWAGESGVESQQGFAFRVRRDGSRWRTVTVTKNTLFGMTAYFNVHTWDSARPTAIATVGHFPIAGLMAHGTIHDLPWHACGRVRGDVVTLKVWLAGRAEPRWSDRVHTGSIRLPAGWVFAGRPAWYAGHLPPGGTTDYTHISARALPPAG